MVFRVTSVALVALLWVPFFARAESVDVLLVSLNYTKSTDTAVVISVEERVLDQSRISLSGKGDLEVALSNGTEIISKNAYAISTSTDTSMEVFTENGEGSYVSPPEMQSITLALPLPRSIEAERSVITVSKDGKTLVQKKLSELPLEIMESKVNRVIPPQSEALPNPVAKPDRAFLWTEWLIPAIILLLAILLGLFLWKRFSRSTPPPPTPPVV
jgi:hypothetical protein